MISYHKKKTLSKPNIMHLMIVKKSCDTIKFVDARSVLVSIVQLS